MATISSCPNVPRRPLDVEDYIDILRRHRGWILGPMFAALVVSMLVAFLWPDTYVSVAVLRVVPPQVPENFVPANVNADVQGRVNSLVQLILNRATLTNIINTCGLYKRELALHPLDDVIEDMRLRDIRVSPVQQSLNPGRERQQYPAFEIRYAYRDRFLAQKVTTYIVARFLEENVQEVSQQTIATTQFLHDQWDAAKKKLDGFEQKLSVFRSQNMGRLPEEQQNNYQQLATFETQKLNVNMSLNRVNQDRLIQESQLRIYRDQLASLKDPVVLDSSVQQKTGQLTEKDREIAQYEDALANARERYKETHPDVQRLTNRLASARKQREAMLKQEAQKPEINPPQPSAQFVRDQRELKAAIERTQGLIQAKDLEMEDYRKQVVQLDAAIQAYQARLESVPVGIKGYEELIRDRDLAKKEYEDLDRRLNSSAMATALQNRQAGERLEQLDPPSLPQTPTEPKRAGIVSIGAGIGLIAGLCLAGAREMKDKALKNLKDVRAYTQLPVLGTIPLLESDRVVKRRKRLTWLAWSTAGLIGVMIMSGSVVYYYATKL